MKDFCEAILTLDVNEGMACVYQKAIERENSPFGLRDHWNGNHAHVEISGNQLTISLLSHTLPNLKQTVDWYERVGAEVVYKSYDT
ncbi:hypothetical protein ACJZRC_000580 [Enterococcus hirae]